MSLSELFVEYSGKFFYVFCHLYSKENQKVPVQRVELSIIHYLGLTHTCTYETSLNFLSFPLFLNIKSATRSGFRNVNSF